MQTEILEDINPENLEEQELHFLDCRKILETGMWLMRNGYGRLRILPYVAPSGCHWRCDFHPSGMPGKPVFRYSSSSSGKYLNDFASKPVRRSITPRGLGRAILRNADQDSFDECIGSLSTEMEAWLILVDRALAMRWLPQAFDDNSVQDSRSKWTLVDITGTPTSWIDPAPDYVIPTH